MGNRYGRKKTRKYKSGSNGSRPVKPAIPGSYRHCKARSMEIDGSVCTVYQVRQPEQCFGCMHYRG